MKTVVLSAMILSSLGIALGQAGSPSGLPARAKPENPRARLAFLVGKYTTEVRLLPNRMMKKESVGIGTSDVSWGLDSMFLFVDERNVNPALGAYKGFGVLGYDMHDKQYTLSMYNNFGDHPQYRGVFAGDTLVLAAKIPAPGKTFDQQVRWYSEGENVHLDVLNDTGEGFVPVIQEIAQRTVR